MQLQHRSQVWLRADPWPGHSISYGRPKKFKKGGDGAGRRGNKKKGKGTGMEESGALSRLLINLHARKPLQT